MNYKVNIGIIGCGYWGSNLIRNFNSIKNVQILSVCDIDSKKLKPLKHRYNLRKIYNNYRYMLKDIKLDAVVISTPAITHYRITKEALRQGKHVLVEKPMAVDSKQAIELIELSKKVKKTLMVGHTFLFNPAVNKIKEIICKGDLGRLYYIHARRTNLGPIRFDVNALWDLAPHDVSIINYLLGSMPNEVSAEAIRFLPHKLEDVGFIILRYVNSIIAHIHVSWLDPKKVREMTIIGSRKMVVYDDTDIDTPIRIYDKNLMEKRYRKSYYTFKEFKSIVKNGKCDKPKLDIQEPLMIECQHFIDCIINNKRPLTDGYEGLNIIKVMEAIDKSSRSNNKAVKIE
ncbi:MAG: Gfo/Idh/MocA family oxidoreductase [Candidatus Omnitrophica bacterium]|nr:Gfo/Idh/MocA family oxidoreductase [Candidatus Omnitrophota bacterium]